MNVVETDYWCLMLPSAWSADEEEGSVLIIDQDGIGELAITTLVRKMDDTSTPQLAEIARAESPEVNAWAAAMFGGRWPLSMTKLPWWQLAMVAFIESILRVASTHRLSEVQKRMLKVKAVILIYY